MGVMKERRGTDSRATPGTKLAIALRYLAGGEVIDLRLIYHVSHCYVYKCVWAVVDAINRHVKIEFPIDDVEKLKVLEAECIRQIEATVWPLLRHIALARRLQP